MPQNKNVLIILFVSAVVAFVILAFTYWPKATKEIEDVELVKLTQVSDATENSDAWLEGADIKNGHNLSRICVACHTFDEGGPKRFSTNLFGIVGDNYARDASYEYSPAMKALSHKKWTTKDLDKWIENPAGFIPGTNMLFNGLNDPRHRRDLIAYMKSLK